MASGDDEGRDSGAPPSPREQEILDLLAGAARSAPGPDAQTTARMRARLMAAVTAPEGDGARAHDVGRAGDRSRPTGRRRARTGTRPAGRAARRSGADRPDGRPAPGRRARLLARAAGSFAVVVLLGLVLVVLSRDALPGETLYAVKRASETTELGLTTGAEQRARRHLQLAEVRLSEVSGLLGQASGSASGPVAAGPDPARSALVADTLADFEDETREGVRLFLPLTTTPSGPAPAVLAGWARAQTDHLDAIAPSLVGASRPALDSSLALLGQVTARADDLGRPEAACPRTATDAWGPVPSCPPAAPAAPGSVADPAATVDPSAVTSTTASATTEPDATDTGTTRSGVPTRRPASVATPAPVVPGVPRLPTVDPPRLPAAPRVPGLPPVEVPPVVPGLPGLGGG